MEIKLNLIPQERRFEISQVNMFRAVLWREVGLTLILVVFIMLLCSLNYLLKINLIAQTVEFENVQNKKRYERIDELNKNFKDVNALVSFNEIIQGDQLYWYRIFQKINKALPKEVGVVKLANNNYKFILAGTSETRDALVLMKDNFTKENCFADVNLPLSSFASKENIDFQIEFNIKEECLKNK